MLWCVPLLTWLVWGLLKEADSQVDLIVPLVREPALTALPGEYREEAEGVIRMQVPAHVGYAGLILANGGLEGDSSSFLGRRYGIRLRLSEKGDHEAFHRGLEAGVITSPDYLAAYGAGLNVVAVAAPCFHRLDDVLITRQWVRSLADLVGETVIVPQYSVADYLIREGVRRRGLGLRFRDGLESPADARAVNLVFTARADHAAEVFSWDLRQGNLGLAGCAAWDPFNEKVVRDSAGYAYYLTDLGGGAGGVTADVLVFNRPFASARGEAIRGIVHGVLWGNERMNALKERSREGQLRPEDSRTLQMLASLLRTGGEASTPEDLLTWMEDCDYANYALNRAYFEGRMVRGQSFAEHFAGAATAFGLPLARAGEATQMGTVDVLEELEDAFAGSRHRLTALEGLAEAAPSWTPVEVSFLPRKVSAVDLSLPGNEEALGQVVDYLSWNETSFVVLQGYLNRPETSLPSESEKRRDRGDPGGKPIEEEGGIDWEERARELSLRRARAVKTFLLDAGIAEERIEIEGMGWSGELGNRVRVEMLDME